MGARVCTWSTVGAQQMETISKAFGSEKSLISQIRQPVFLTTYMQTQGEISQVRYADGQRPVLLGGNKRNYRERKRS